MKQILVIGDSFAADWSVKYSDYLGWPNLLAQHHSVTNLAQCGVAEYRIYQQLLSVQNLAVYDWVIVSHTSPYRVVTRHHPVHGTDSLHGNADLMLVDIEHHAGKLRNIFNRSLRAAINYFDYHYDIDYHTHVYRLFRAEINRLLVGKNVIVISNLPILQEYTTENTVLDFSELMLRDPGLINHFSEQGNRMIYKQIEQVINN